MKNLILLMFLCIILSAAEGFAQVGQSNRIDTTYINPADSINAAAYASDSLSNPVDMWENGVKRLTAIEFPAAFTADTIYIQTAEYDVDALYIDAYYTKSDGTQVTMHVPVQASKRVGINPLWAEVLSRYIRFRSDVAEGSTDRKIVSFGH